MMVRLLAARNQPLYDSLIEFRLAPKALLKSAWGIAPGIQVATKRALKARFS
jgi:hypothetical protein